jgi:hypothetical protein
MSKSPDATVAHFYYNTDLTVDQPVDLPDGSFFKARRTKDEDVQIVNGQLTVVATDVTTISQTIPKTDYSYEYSDMKKEVQRYAKKCKDLGVKLNGQVVVYADGENYFRIRVVDNVVDVEGAVLAFPTGGLAPRYEDW